VALTAGVVAGDDATTVCPVQCGYMGVLVGDVVAVVVASLYNVDVSVDVSVGGKRGSVVEEWAGAEAVGAH
jgi:hypothetical protein